ncbi:MAG: carboxypeptidase regulatory-like domain-containing protein, partial [Burkholderiaceae bacterium]
MRLENPHDFLRSALALAVAAIIVPAAAQNTTAALAGRVNGADGKPVAGASVAIVHKESGATSVTTTDAEGRFSARGLRVGGPFLVTVSQGGRTEKQDGVFLTLAETTSLSLVLGGPSATVTVSGRSVSDVFDRAAMGAGTNITNAEVQAMASIQRSLQDYARFDPRLAQTDKERSEISAAGQNTRYNSITIDGVTTNDTFGLESNNLPTIKQPVSIEAIQSVQVNVSNYDVTQKGYTGANINAVTKSGSNDVKGSVYYVYRNQNLAGDRYNASNNSYFDAPKFKEETKGFTLGGPIIKDKLFFFVNHEQFESSRTRPSFGPIGSPTTNVGITQQMINDAIGIAKNTYGVDVGTADVPQGVAVNVKDSLLKLDWNINQDHKASLRFTRTEQTEPFLVGFSATGLSLSSYWYNQEKKLDSLVGQWFADWSPNFSTEVKVSKRDYESMPIPVNGVRLPQIALRFSGALPDGSPTGVSANSRDLLMGTERSRHFNVLKTETLDTYIAGNYNLGDHELKFGVDYADNDVYNAFLQDTNGQYRFQCENSSSSLSYSFGSINCASANASQVAAAVLENFRLGRPSFYQVQLPLAGRSLNDGVAVWSYQNTGFFA